MHMDGQEIVFITQFPAAQAVFIAGTNEKMLFDHTD
jgi:hypothetical protein